MLRQNEMPVEAARSVGRHALVGRSKCVGRIHPVGRIKRHCRSRIPVELMVYWARSGGTRPGIGGCLPNCSKGVCLSGVAGAL